MISGYHPHPLIQQISIIYLLCQVGLGIGERAENKAKSISKILHPRRGRHMINKAD